MSLCEGVISGQPPPPPVPPVDRDDISDGVISGQQPPTSQPGDLVYTISWVGHKITNVRVVVLTSVVLLFAHKCLSILFIGHMP